MIRTIIVDDEILARIGIKSFIDGREDISVSGVFASTADAISFLQSNEVDMIITDIEMAGGSGLEFIRQIRADGFSGGVIIISCHDEFSYAQEAIELGTDAYLLKINLDQEKLIEEIRRINELHTKRSIAAERNKQEKSDKPGIDVISEGGSYQIAVIRLKDEQNRWNMKEGDGRLIVNLLEDIVSHYQMGTLFTPYNRETFLMLSYSLEKGRDDIEKICRKNIDILCKNVSQYLNMPVLVGVSALYTDLKETRQHYLEAVSACEMKYYDRHGDVYFFECLDDAYAFNDLHCSIHQFLTDPSSLAGELQGMCSEARIHHMPVDRFKSEMLRVLNNLSVSFMADAYFREQLYSAWEKDMPYAVFLAEASDASDFMERISAGIKRFVEEIHKSAADESMARVLTYIESHLDRELTLPELAAAAGMSVPSFCRHFKECLGMTTTQLINEKRIEKAKTMLLAGSYSLQEIAFACGFSNDNYLTRVFKKVTGKTISEFRDIKMNQD